MKKGKDVVDINTYVFEFGKYKGKSYRKVSDINPGYLIWCHNNVDSFTLDKIEFNHLRERCSRYLRIYRPDDSEYDDGDGEYFDINPYNLDFG